MLFRCFRGVVSLFVAGGVYEWYQYQEYMRKGYFWVEVISYIVCAIWFLIDVNTTKCIREIRGIEEWLIQALREHEDYVEKYKDKMKRINKRKDRLLKVLEEFYPKKFFSDPLKNLRKEIDISRANNYQIQSSMFKVIDTHTHLDAEEFDEDRLVVV